MKSMIISYVAILASFCCYAEDESEKYGGQVKLSGKGYVAAIDCRSNGNSEDFAEGMKAVADTFLIDVRPSKGKAFSLQNATSQLQTSGGNCAVFIIDDTNMPMSLSASEEKWAMLNVAKISSDSPAKQQYKRRISLLFARQAFRSLGADESKSVDTCLHSVFKPSDLDEITTYDLPMGPEMAIPETMRLRGIEKIEYGTYEEACGLGVAAKPTNTIQKTIWDKVHAPPTKPLKITYDKDKQKPVVK